MHYTKGKWVASRKDTYSVESTLNKIILAHLIKLKKCLVKSKMAGIPMFYVEKQADLQGVDKWSDEVDLDEADELRFKDLEELIWVFGENEPDISSYGFHYNVGKTGFQCSNKEERDHYHQDMIVYAKRRDEAYKLFGEIYYHLSW